MSVIFPEIKKKLGFGMMRLPELPEKAAEDDKLDYGMISRMVDSHMAAGFNYFDTARPYCKGFSEVAVGKCLAARYPRESFVLANKLSNLFFEKEADIRPLFEDQLKTCGVEYFDFYLMHALNRRSYEKYKAEHAFDMARKFKAEGKIRHLAMSFHDSADILDMILTEQPDVEAVQLQFNYLDMEDPKVQAKACYDICVKHGKPVIVMEPVRGGKLANMAPEAMEILKKRENGSAASYAIRFAASFENVFMVLSGMSNEEQMADNHSFMAEFKPLTDEEFRAVDEVRAVLKSKAEIGCTACRYCTDGCPMSINIPKIFAAYNNCMSFTNEDKASAYRNGVGEGGKASECIGCGQCEGACPQNLPIREYLSKAAALFE